MRLELTGRHVEITPALRRLVDTKLVRLDRLLKDAAVSAQVVLTCEKRSHRADVTLHARGEKFLHGVGTAPAWEPSLTLAVGKIAQQAQRVKGKWQARKRRGVRAASVADVPEAGTAAPSPRTRQTPARVRMPRILNRLRQTMKIMSVADAAREVEANGGGAVVFQDAESASVSVVYRGQGGELTLVETET